MTLWRTFTVKYKLYSSENFSSFFFVCVFINTLLQRYHRNSNRNHHPSIFSCFRNGWRKVWKSFLRFSSMLNEFVLAADIEKWMNGLRFFASFTKQTAIDMEKLFLNYIFTNTHTKLLFWIMKSHTIFPFRKHGTKITIKWHSQSTSN